MRRFPTVILFFLGTLIFISAAPVSAQTAQSDLQAAVDALDAWLGTSKHGPVWHEYLQTDDLKKQMENGPDADLDAVREVLAQYNSRKSGLTHKNFVTVRDAIEAWLEEVQLPKQGELGEVATTAVEEIEPPVKPEQLEQARTQLNETLESFDRFLKRGGEDKEQGWKEYLRLEDLQAELNEESPHRDTLVQVWAILAGDAQGLTNSRFVTLREALRKYLELSELPQGEGEGEDQENVLAKLPEQLKAYQKSANEENTAALGETLSWLERTKQADDAVRAIRYHFARPNFLVEASDRLVTYGFAEEIDETDPVNDYSNGNSTSGTATTKGTVTAKLVPNGRYGEVQVDLKGVSNSSTRTYNNSGVTFNTRGVTQIAAEKSVLFTNGGFKDQPAVARCTTDNTTSNIRANSAQVENIARQRIAQSERSSELRAARRTEDRIERDLNRRVREQLADANKQMQDDFFGPLARRGVEPRLLKYHSSADTLYGTMILAAPEHLAAPNEPPAMKSEGDLTARVHASWVNNMADVALRGSLLTDVSLANALEEWRGEVPEELQVTEESEPWDITFASRRPVLFEVGNDRLTVTLRGVRFTARDRTMHEPMHISAAYRIERAGGATRLLRDGDVSITFPEQGEKLSVRYLTLRKFWQTKFSALFTPELDDLNLRLRGAWESAGPLELTAFGARDNGWIGMAWAMPEKKHEQPEKAEDKGAE